MPAYIPSIGDVSLSAPIGDANRSSSEGFMYLAFIKVVLQRRGYPIIYKTSRVRPARSHTIQQHPTPSIGTVR